LTHSLDYTEEDEAGYGDDDLQQDNETGTKGSRLVKQKHGSTIDHTTVSADPLDANVLPLSDPEHFEDEGDNGPELPRTLSPSIVKQQNKERLNAALAEFGKPLVTLRDAANYITKLPKAEHEVAEWQTAMEMLQHETGAAQMGILGLGGLMEAIRA
jgi:hypothetical protein